MSDSAPHDPLAELRRRIDDIDAELVRLISERGRVAREVGRVKTAQGTPVYSPDREKQVLERLAALNQGPFSEQTLRAVYREIMSGSFTLERALRVAYLGPAGSHSHLAAIAKFGRSVEYEPVTAIRAAFAEVQRRHADFAMVPVENSISGGVGDTLDAFVEFEACICAETFQPIHHHLLARCPLEKVQRVYSKPQILEQCRRWLLETGLDARATPVASSSKAAEMAAREEGSAALGSSLAAELYGLPIQVPHVEDSAENVTRFFVIGHESAKPTGNDRTSLLFGTADRAGALVGVLDEFRRAQVNLTMITSRPSRQRNWEYCFFLDADGHAAESHLRSAMEAARPHCTQLRVLGSYPRAAVVR